MSGLLQRAADYRARRNQQQSQHEEDEYGLEEFGATPAERQEIIDHIETVVSSSQGDVGSDMFKVNAKRSGVGLPLIVNLVAVALVAAGSLVLFRIFSEQETTAVVEATSLSSAEGLLLRQLREQSEALLSEKEGEILKIQDELREIATERESLAQTIGRQLQEQEDSLRLRFESDLAAERDRLLAESLSEDEVERQLAQFQAAEQARYEAGLADLRNEAEAEIAEREAALSAQVADAQRLLANAQSERESIEAGLREERDETLAILTDLQARQEQERLVSEQIVSIYASVQNALEQENLNAALEGTSELREYLSSGPVLALPAVQRRRSVELFLVDSLEQRILDEQIAALPNSEELVETVEVVSRVTALVNQAETAFGSRDFNAARTLYLSAMSEIPAVQIGYERLGQIADRAEEQESGQLAQFIRQGNDLYRSGRYTEAANSYGRAVSSLPAGDTELMSRILDAGYQLRRGEDLSALRAVQAELEAAKSEIANREATIDNRDDVIAGLREEAAQRSAQIAELTATRATLQSTIDGLRAELDIATSQPEVVETRVDPEVTARIAALETEIESAESQIDSLELQITDLTGSLETSRAQTAALQTQLQAVAGIQAFYTDQEELAEEISRYRRRVSTTESATSTLPATLDLLESKLIIVRVLESDSVRAQYPNLADRLEEYLDSLIDEQRRESSLETMQEVNAVLDFILDESTTAQSITSGDVPPAPGAAAAESNRFLELLGSLTGPE